MNTEDKDKRLDGDTESLQNDGADAFGSEIFGELEFKEVVVPVEKAEHLYGRGVSPGTQAPQGNAGHSAAAGQSAAQTAQGNAGHSAAAGQSAAQTAQGNAGHSTAAGQSASQTAQGNAGHSTAAGRSAATPSQPSTRLQGQSMQNKRTVQKKTIQKSGATPGGSTLPSVVKAVIYIVCVLVVSVFLSYFIISVGNDVFAFSKDDTVCSVQITEYMTLDDVAQLLHENGLIKHPKMFKFYMRLKKVQLDFVPGTYEVSPQLNYEEFIDVFNNAEAKRQRETLVITIPEGYTTDEIIDLLCAKGIGTREKYVDVINHFDFGDSYRFLNELPDPLPQGRIYRLDGYLFPDTYYFFQDASEADVIDKFLQNTAVKLTDDRFEKAQEEGFTMDQLITLASIIQAEGRYVDEFEDISSVFHNRLADPVRYPYLQSDATIQYVLPERTVDLTESDLATDSPYNTYLYPGLTPGAICNPGLNAIDAALYPNSTNYYYFVADAEGHSIFSRTDAEHNAAKRKIKAAAQN